MSHPKNTQKPDIFCAVLSLCMVVMTVRYANNDIKLLMSLWLLIHILSINFTSRTTYTSVPASEYIHLLNLPVFNIIHPK